MPHDLSRRRVLQLGALGAAAPVLARWATQPAEAAPPTGPTLVLNGVATAVVVYPDTPAGPIQTAVSELVAYVAASTGATLPAVTVTQLADSGSEYASDVRVYVGVIGSDADPQLSTRVAALHHDGFVVDAYQQTLSIVGPAPEGALTGVYEFLRTAADVRWLLPGPNGDDVPQRSTLTAATGSTTLDPPCIGRYPFLGALPSPGLTAWATYAYNWTRRNGAYPYDDQLLSFGHNMSTIFGVPTGQQPDFSDPATVTTAVNWVLGYFDENPDATSVSLSVNDGGGYVEADPSNPNYPGRVNSIGALDMSDIYFGWLEQVVEGVLEQRPALADKWFCALAYNETADPPSFDLNSRIVPVITRDRHEWADLDARAAGQAQNAGWLARAAQVAWWEYIWGAPYMVPRLYPHVWSLIANYAAEHRGAASGIGGVHVYAEDQHTLAEGPKKALALRLMIDPTEDPDAYISEWCTRTVGAAAAPYLSAYLAHWADFWENRILAADWFVSRKGGNYLNYLDPGYLNAVTEDDITQSRSWLQQAVDLAGTPDQQARAQLLLDAFAYYEASALSYPRRTTPPTDQNSASQLLTDTTARLDSSITYANDRATIVTNFSTNAVLGISGGLGDSGPYNYLSWSGWNFHPMWDLGLYLRAHEPSGGPVTTQVENLAATSTSPNVVTYCRGILAVATGNLTALGANLSFESGSTTPLSWDVTPVLHPAGSVSRTTEFARTGTASLRVQGGFAGGTLIVQQVFPTSGFFRFAFWYYTPAGTESIGRILFIPVIRDGAGNVNYLRNEARALSTTAGTWTQYEWMDQLPDGVASLVVYLYVYAPEVGVTVYVDDVEMYQLAP